MLMRCPPPPPLPAAAAGPVISSLSPIMMHAHCGLLTSTTLSPRPRLLEDTKWKSRRSRRPEVPGVVFRHAATWLLPAFGPRLVVVCYHDASPLCRSCGRRLTVAVTSLLPPLAATTATTSSLVLPCCFRGCCFVGVVVLFVVDAELRCVGAHVGDVPDADRRVV